MTSSDTVRAECYVQCEVLQITKVWLVSKNSMVLGGVAQAFNPRTQESL